MAKKLSHDQKRKAKLKKRAERTRESEALGYTGDKYKTEKYVPLFFVTERGIIETHLMLGRSLTDDVVENALGSLVGQLREGLSPIPAEEDANKLPGEPVDAIIASIRRNWSHMAADGGELNRDELIGILRSIIGSIRFWRVQGKDSMGYLRYLEDFIAKTGAVIQVQRRGGSRAISAEDPEEPKALGSESDAS